jgi:hypothetical protein
MTDNLGEGVSRVLDPATTQFLSVIWQAGLCPLDSEWNLVGDLAAGFDRQRSLLGTPSGWFGNDINPSKDYQTDPTWSNWFKFGRQRSGDKQSIMWAVVNGWLVPVAGTQTGDPPGSPDDTDTWNKVTLEPPPGSAGDARADFVFLEVWKARIAPYPSTINKPNGSAIFKLGNVEGGFSYLPDDILDPAIGEETTERVQLQYRIRVVKGLINLSTNPDGFDPTVVKAQGAQATPPSVGGYTFANMRETLGDPGLWRAGDGTQNVLGTVDGYVYAIPICIVFRRNAILWAGEPSQNLNGGFNRNPTAVDRTGTLTFSTVPTLAADLSASSFSATLVSSSNIPLPLTPASSVTIKIDEELITYSGISGTILTITPTTGRGANGTAAAVHKAGATITVVSTRPDGLYSDQITGTDVLDLRHAVNPAGFNYHSTLRSNLDKLLKGQLRANWKRTGTDPRGIYLLYEDKISLTPPISLGVTQLDGPDHIRMIFSDAAVQQPVEVIFKPTTWSGPSPTFPVAVVQPWGLHVNANIVAQATTAIWTIGDQLSIPVDQFKTGVSVSDADQIRFLNDQPASGTGTSSGTDQFIDATNDYVASGVEIGDTLVITVNDSPIAAGSYTIIQVTTTVLTVSTTIPAATLTPYVIRKGTGAVQIRVEGQATSLPQHYFTVTPPNPSPTDNLVITLVAGTYSPLSPANVLNLYATTHIQYGSGRGLSRRPDSIHNIALLNPNAQLLHQVEYSQANTFQLRTAWTALWSKFRGDTYKSLLPVTAESYADLGSKTVAITPFQAIQFPVPSPITGSIMTPSGSDPLALFDHTRYALLPRHLVPGWGAVEVPIIPVTSGGNFHRGINFMLMSQERVATNTTLFNTEYINYSIAGGQLTCAIFSTLNLQTSLPLTYNTATGDSFIISYAGMRLFNDDPTVIGALSTARGLGRQGLELPPYYGIARLFAVYEAQDYKIHGSSFNVGAGGDRTFTGTGATNLLRGDFIGPTFWIEKDVNGDSTFILNADTIDLTKSPNPISTFASGNYIIEACVFGFDRGAFDLSQPFKMAISLTASSSLVNGPNTILPGPLTTTDTALINYSRTPYQGDAWGTETSFSDKGHTQGPLLSADAYQLASTSLIPNMLTRPNQKPLEVLASVGFITTLGTGRLSGDFSLANAYDIRNVGYEDPTDPSAPYPPHTSGGPRPLVKSGALGSLANYGDLEANPEYLGCTERLPLGALYRDKDFHGSRFSDELSSPLVYLDTAGVGSGVAGLARTSELDQTEALMMPASVSAGVPGDVLVMVDGSPADYTQLLNYRVNRGGSVFVGSGDRPGGEVFATYSRLLGSGKGSRVLVGRAFLVRNAPTSAGSVEVSGGDELMMAITTQVMELGTTPIEAMILLGTNGSSEGYAAADLYRIEGHPIITNHTFYDVDPSTIQLPLGKTIAQITAPSPTPAIPIGAASTVYASDGTRNFWTNIPTLTGLDIVGNLVVSGTASVSGNLLATSSALTFTNATRIGTTNLSSGTTSSLLVSTGDGSGTASTGNLTVTPGTSSGSGAAGGLVLNGGSSTGSSGNGGNVIVAGGTTFNGNGGNVTVRGGTAGVSGNGGSVTIASGLGTVTNGSVIVKIGPLVTVASFNNVDLILGLTSGTGNYGIQFTAGVTNPSISQATGTGPGNNLSISSQSAGSTNNSGGSIYFTTGIGLGTGGAGGFSFSNGFRNNLRISGTDTESTYFGTNIVEVGDTNAFDIFSSVFSSRVIAPKIGQKATNGDVYDYTLTIKAADIATAFLGKGADLALFAGNAAGDVSHPKPGGDIYLKTGKGSFDRSGQVFVQVETGTTMSPAPVTVATITQSAVIVDVNDLVFDPAVNAPLVAQQDATGADGSNLKVQAQKGDQTAGSSHSGGNLILISGAHGPSGGSNGVIEIQLGNHSYPRAIVDENGIGIAHTELAGTNCGLGLDTSSNDPPVHPGSVDTVLYVNSFGDVRSSNSRGVITLNGTVNRIVDTSSFTASPVTASSPTALMASFPTFTGVLEGDIIEGSACFHVVAAASTGNVGTIYLILKDGSTLDIYQYSFSMNAAIDTIVTIPFSYTAGPSTTATVGIRPEAASSDGTTGIYVSAIGSTGKWLFSKQTRP